MRFEYKVNAGDFIYKDLESELDIISNTTDSIKLNDLYKMAYELNKYQNKEYYHKVIGDKMMRSISIDRINQSIRDKDCYILYIPKVGYLELTLSGKKYLHLMNIYIVNHMRKKGIAQKLINYAKYFAIMHGKKILSYTCHEDNLASQMLAKNLGFKPC